MARKGCTKVIYKGTFVSEQSLHGNFSQVWPLRIRHYSEFSKSGMVWHKGIANVKLHYVSKGILQGLIESEVFM